VTHRKKRITRTRADLEAQLQERLRFLRTSTGLYDAGDRSEAKRLANTLRILLSDEGRCRSLLGQLGMLGIGFTNTNARLNPANLADHMGLLTIKMSMRDGVVSGSFEPHVLGGPPILPGAMPFSVWWAKDIVLTQKPQVHTFTRRDLVGFLANQDGGSHVDPALDPIYHALSRGESMGWKLVTPAGPQTILDPVSPCVRQIAHEVIATLANPRQLSPFAREATWYARHVEGTRKPAA
jgi:hypothetical protein